MCGIDHKMLLLAHDLPRCYFPRGYYPQEIWRMSYFYKKVQLTRNRVNVLKETQSLYQIISSREGKTSSHPWSDLAFNLGHEMFENRYIRMSKIISKEILRNPVAPT